MSADATQTASGDVRGGAGAAPASAGWGTMKRRQGKVRAMAVAWEAAALGKAASKKVEEQVVRRHVVINVGKRQPTRPTWRLRNVSEQCLLKMGLVCLSREAMQSREKPLAELPKRSNGQHILLRPSFYERLLSKEVEFKSCMESDVCASQCDLRHLDYDQLLSIRADTLDFATESVTHSARNNFLNSVDLHLFVKLAKRCCAAGGPDGVGTVTPQLEQQKQPVLHALGIRIAILRGAIQLLRQEQKDDVGAPVPVCWAMSLDPEEWNSCSFALFHCEALRIDILRGEDPDFAAAAAGCRIGVVVGKSSGIGKDRRMDWQVASFDPEHDNIVQEMNRDPDAPVEKSEMDNELCRTIKKFCHHREGLQLEKVDVGHA